MKKLISIALSSLLVFVAIGSQPQAKAADRVTKIVRICKYNVTTAANASADAVLTRADGGGAYCDVSDMVVNRVVLEDNITALTGTSVVFKAITTSDPTNTGGATTDPTLTGADGSTAFVSASISATGRHAKGTTIGTIGSSGVAQNLGTKIGVWADVTSLTVLDGTVWLVIFGTQ